MTTAPHFLLVDEHVARNPIARAVAKQRVVQATRDFCVRLYMLREGERVDGDLQASAQVLAVAIRILEAQGQWDTPGCRVMRGGMNALVQLAQRGARWRTDDAPAINQALKEAVTVYSTATAQQTQDAHRWVASLDRSAQQQEQTA